MFSSVSLSNFSIFCFVAPFQMHTHVDQRSTLTQIQKIYTTHSNNETLGHLTRYCCQLYLYLVLPSTFYLLSPNLTDLLGSMKTPTWLCVRVFQRFIVSVARLLAKWISHILCTVVRKSRWPTKKIHKNFLGWQNFPPAAFLPGVFIRCVCEWNAIWNAFRLGPEINYSDSSTYSHKML